ncbi:hypothetical protein A2U01_0027705, partial [Trifolium medium]|nr:hypothetical protein [Trifolium medium]
KVFRDERNCGCKEGSSKREVQEPRIANHALSGLIDVETLKRLHDVELGNAYYMFLPLISLS